jgi:hypothetical protein
MDYYWYIIIPVAIAVLIGFAIDREEKEEEAYFKTIPNEKDSK